MCALGQKQTFAVQKGHVRFTPRKRTFWGANAMSALVQKRTSAVQAETTELAAVNCGRARY